MSKDDTILIKRKDAAALRVADVSWAVLSLLAIAFVAARALFDHHLVSKRTEAAVWILAPVAAIARVLIARRIIPGGSPPIRQLPFRYEGLASAAK